MVCRRPPDTKTDLIRCAARSRRGARVTSRARRRSPAVSVLTAMAVVVAVLPLSSGSAGALGLPSPRVPSLAVPSLTVPSITVPPVGNTPPVTTPPVGTPSVRTPPIGIPSGSTPASGIHTPSVGPVPSVSLGTGPLGTGAAGGSSSSASASAASSPSPFGVAASSTSGGPRSSLGADRRLAARRLVQARQRQQSLQALVKRLNGCLSTLAPQARRLLLLRTGTNSSRAYTPREVAGMLHINLGREAGVEHAAVSELQASASAGRCGLSSVAVLQVPAQAQLVAVSPALAGTGQAQQSAYPAGSGQTAGAARRGSGAPASSGSAPGPAASAVEKAAFGSLPTSSTSATVLVLGGAALLGLLALLSAAGRRLAVREQLAMASAPSARAAISAPLAATAATASPATTAGDGPAAEDEPDAADEPIAGDEPAAALAVPVDDARLESGATAPAAKPEPWAPSASEPPVAGRKLSPNQEWLHTHRSQIALVLTAAAGGTLRVISRSRRRR